jgi:hypothetical protein
VRLAEISDRLSELIDTGETRPSESRPLKDAEPDFDLV